MNNDDDDGWFVGPDADQAMLSWATAAAIEASRLEAQAAAMETDAAKLRRRAALRRDAAERYTAAAAKLATRAKDVAA
jgi:hypothetical protein